MISVIGIRQALRFAGKLIGCTDTCMAMLANAQALGGMHVTELIVRDLSGEAHPDPDSPGLDQMQLETVGRRLHIEYTDMTGHDWVAFGRAVSARRLVIASLWYADIGGTPIGHAVLVVGRIGRLYAIYDPMKGTRSTVSPTKLHKAMQTFATKAHRPSGLIYGQSRRVPTIA